MTMKEALEYFKRRKELIARGYPWEWSGMMRPPQSWCYVEVVSE